MERLPTEVLDNIVSYVEDWETLAALRQVDKTFCRSASKGLFRRVVLGVGYKPAITPEFEALAGSEYAQLVREIDFDPRPIWKEEAWRPLFASNAIQSVQWEPTSQWPSVVLRAIAYQKDHNVTRLTMSIDNTAYLTRCIANRQEKPVTQLIRQIQHLDLHGTHKDEDRMDDLHMILKTAANLISLKVNGYGPVFNPAVKTFHFRQPLRLKSLSLIWLSITSYNLLGLLEWCKDTISSVTIGFLELDAGSWLHILIQIKKNLKLLELYFYEWDVARAEEIEDGNEGWRWHGKFRRDHELIGCAIGDLQRQANANRVAEGLLPLSKKGYRELDLPTLESRMEEARYAELISRSWDAEKDDTYHCDSD